MKTQSFILLFSYIPRLLSGFTCKRFCQRKLCGL